jgi:hypothetical protein
MNVDVCKWFIHKTETIKKLFRQTIITKMSDSLKESIGYNNAACAHIQNGNFETAADVLDLAFQALKKHLLWCQSNLQEMELSMKEAVSGNEKSSNFLRDVVMESSNEHQDSSTQQVDRRFMMDLRLGTTKEILKSVPVVKFRQGQLSINDVPSFDIYNKAFLFSLDDVDTDNKGHSTFEKVENWVCVVLMYNTALVHYNIGASTNMNACDLHRSLKFFEIADEMLTMMARPFDFDLLLLTAATANNMGHIYVCLHSSEEAKIHYKMLEGTLHVLQWMPQLDEDDYCLFFMNTGIYVDSLRAAPAA